MAFVGLENDSDGVDVSLVSLGHLHEINLFVPSETKQHPKRPLHQLETVCIRTTNVLRGRVAHPSPNVYVTIMTIAYINVCT